MVAFARRVDYSVYFVTDPSPTLLRDRALRDVVLQAILGGVTIVQLRDKHAAHEDVVGAARELLDLTRKWEVPLLINDHVDVACEVGCQGVHLGQEDMDVAEARRRLGPGKIIGVTASSEKEALRACKAGADYLGLGTVYATATKSDTKATIGPEGVRTILKALTDAGYGHIPAVCIGGINLANAADVLHEARLGPRTSDGMPPRGVSKGLDGLAVVSALTAADTPEKAARALYEAVLRDKMDAAARRMMNGRPLSHNMTNLVVQNFAANVALALGASPIMSMDAREAPDLARNDLSALVVNMGSVTAETVAQKVNAVKAYNAAGRPIILDPVGAGATSIRREALKALLAAGHYAVIKGNTSEMLAISALSEAPSSTAPQRGVDSSATLDLQKTRLLQRIATRYRTVALLTGPEDLLSDGRSALFIRNGVPLLGRITGSGCALGTAISIALAANPKAPLPAALAATLLYEIAAERAVEDAAVKGPGTFVSAFLDALDKLAADVREAGGPWLERVKLVVWNCRAICQ